MTADIHLNDRISSTEGMITLTGVQALLRSTVDQHRIDAARGLRTATLISGYRGSPLGNVEGAFEQHRALFDAADVKFVSGVNEDLAATAIWGSQMTVLESDVAFDGVKGMWYGKGPGVDRSGDAIRHAMFSGVGPNGGVLALAGDDPECKSSTIPSASEGGLADLGMPVLYPGTVEEALRFSLYGYELSRASGLWVGIKVHTDVADGFATIPASSGSAGVRPYVHEVSGRPWTPTVDNRLIAPFSVMLEEELFGHRIDAARGFVRENPLDRSYGATDARLGIIVAGKPHGDVNDALARLGLSPDNLADFGVRIYVPAMISPLEPQALRAFADGLDTVLVVEAKRSFIETQVRDLLYGGPNLPAVYGKAGPDGAALLPRSGVISTDLLVDPLRQILEMHIDSSRLQRERQRIPLLAADDEGLPNRTPYYCSGCPHNRSTVVPDGSIALGGIGCHSMALWMDRDTEGLTQMGGEGAQWVGAAPFVGNQHRFQNLGDGTFFHSGSLAIRQAVASEVNLTFKILYNGVVAMTGGQDAAGEMPVPELSRWLEAEGVVRTVVVTDDVSKYDRSAKWAPNSRVVDRAELDNIQRELREVPGVSALVYDQGCAADLRRNRKRGNVETPTTRIMINEAICEGCGHCGEISNCMSVHPVETPFGRKTRIHQESCNFDLTCVDGNCPAFVEIEIDPLDVVEKVVGGASHATGDVPAEPEIPDAANVLIVGIGGTGVVTVSQVLSTAAMLDGRVATSLDQTGLAQKGGQVISNLHIGSESHRGSAKLSGGDADTMLIFDIVGGASPAVLNRARGVETVAIVSTSKVPTGNMVTDTSNEIFPGLDRFRVPIDAATSAEQNVWVDAEAIGRYVFASQPAANMVLAGAAYQLARLPVSSTSIERAIELNGVAVESNRAAFRLGRRIVDDPLLAETLANEARSATPQAPSPTAEVVELVSMLKRPNADLVDLLHWRLPELIAWGDRAWARTYMDAVASLYRSESAVSDVTPLSEAGARYLFKFMTYKDEYEVARLALANDMGAQARARFGENAKLSFKLMPPTLKNAGYGKKIAVPESAGKATFKSLLKTKRFRGTKLDPFGRTEERVVERELIDDYKDLLARLADGLTLANQAERVAVAELADVVRGFDDIKLANVKRYRESLADAGWS